MSYTNLKFLRFNFNLTTRELADKINGDSSTISKYELGKRGMSLEIVKSLANFFDCSFEFIMQEADFGLYAYYMDKKLVLSIEEYKDLESKNLIEVVDYKRVISSDVEIKNLIPLVYGISMN